MDRESIWTRFGRALLATIYASSTLHVYLKHTPRFILVLGNSSLFWCPLLDHLVVRLGETSVCWLLHEHRACALVMCAAVKLTWNGRAIGSKTMVQARGALVFEVALLLLSRLFHRGGLELLTMRTRDGVRNRVNGLRFV